MNRYREAMSLALAMLDEGIITESEYHKIDRIMAEKHGVNLSEIWGLNPLIYKDIRGNIPSDEKR